MKIKKYIKNVRYYKEYFANATSIKIKEWSNTWVKAKDSADEYDEVAPITEVYNWQGDAWVRILLEERLLPFKAYNEYLRNLATVYTNSYRAQSNQVLEQLVLIKRNTTYYNNAFNRIVLSLYNNKKIRYDALCEIIKSDFIAFSSLITYPNIDEFHTIWEDEYSPYIFNWDISSFKEIEGIVMLIMANTDKMFGLDFYYQFVLPYLFSHYPGINITNYHTLLNGNYNNNFTNIPVPELAYVTS